MLFSKLFRCYLTSVARQNEFFRAGVTHLYCFRFIQLKNTVEQKSPDQG